MKVSKGTLLDVDHTRKGKFIGIATRDFDTDSETFYPIALAEDKAISAMSIMNDDWIKGDDIPCRHSLCQISIHKKS